MILPASLRWEVGAVLALLALPSVSFAAPPQAVPPKTGAAAAGSTAEEEPEDPEEGTRRAAAPDERTWHWLISGRGGFTVPFGSVASAFPATDLIAIGPTVGGSLGVGLGRYGVLEASFGYGKLSGADRPAASGVEGETDTCSELRDDLTEKGQVVGSTCRGRTWNLGLGLSYHLAQGIAFDPWVSYGVGYRSLTVDVVLNNELPGGAKSGTFRGVDVARVGLGGDFYPIPSIGFGPYIELDIGTYVDRPGPSDGSVYAFFGLGAQLVFDPVRVVRPPKTTASR